MTSYDGSATLVTEDGREVPANVRLHTWREGNLGAWGGDGVASSDHAHIMSAGEVKIRMPDGREGDLIITNASVSSGDPVVRLDLTGSGAPPF